MRVKIDRKRCVGHNRCVAIAPEVFDADDEGYALLKQDPVTPDQEANAKRALRSCPEWASSPVGE